MGFRVELRRSRAAADASEVVGPVERVAVGSRARRRRAVDRAVAGERRLEHALAARQLREPCLQVVEGGDPDHPLEHADRAAVRRAIPGGRRSSLRTAMIGPRSWAGISRWKSRTGSSTSVPACLQRGHQHERVSGGGSPTASCRATCAAAPGSAQSVMTTWQSVTSQPWRPWRRVSSTVRCMSSSERIDAVEDVDGDRLVADVELEA